jgi:hypothetical protein
MFSENQVGNIIESMTSGTVSKYHLEKTVCEIDKVFRNIFHVENF